MRFPRTRSGTNTRVIGYYVSVALAHSSWPTPPLRWFKAIGTSVLRWPGAETGEVHDLIQYDNSPFGTTWGATSGENLNLRCAKYTHKRVCDGLECPKPAPPPAETMHEYLGRCCVVILCYFAPVVNFGHLNCTAETSHVLPVAHVGSFFTRQGYAAVYPVVVTGTISRLHCELQSIPVTAHNRPTSRS